MEEIKLGDKVRDKTSGFIGIVTSKTEFLNHCIQYGVQAKMKKDGTLPEPVGIDSQSLEIIEPKEKPEPKIKRRTGGASRPAYKMRGY